MYIGHLLGVQPEPGHRDVLREGDAEDLAAGTRAAFCDWTLRLAQQAPVVVAIEGLHEADVATCQMLEDLLELTDKAPVMVVMSSRPEPDTPAWRFRAHAMTNFGHRFEEIALEPIADGAAGQLLDITASGLLDPTTREELVTRAEGNPLYLEEMAYALEAEEIRPRAWTVTVGTAPALPASLDALLIARMDRLDPDARTLGQTAAVIGREFPARVLERVAGAERFEAGMPGLLRSGVVREVRRYPELEYSFRHGLLQEAARSTLTQARRAAALRARGRGVRGALRRLARRADGDARALPRPEREPLEGARVPRPLRGARRGVGPARRGRPALATGPPGRRADGRPEGGEPAAGAARRGGGGRPSRPPRASTPRPASSRGRTRTRIGPYTLEGVAPTAGAVARALTADDMPVALRLVGRSDGGGAEEWRRLRDGGGAGGAGGGPQPRPRAPGRRGRRLEVPRPRVVRAAARSPTGSWAAGRRRPRRPIRIVVRVARGLDALHRAGVVHGGMRAGSILFDADGRALLVPVATSPEKQRRPRGAGRRGADAGERRLRARGDRPGVPRPERSRVGRPRMGDRHGARGGSGPAAAVGRHVRADAPHGRPGDDDRPVGQSSSRTSR